MRITDRDVVGVARSDFESGTYRHEVIAVSNDAGSVNVVKVGGCIHVPIIHNTFGRRDVEGVNSTAAPE
jgi:hypothetical protein